MVATGLFCYWEKDRMASEKALLLKCDARWKESPGLCVWELHSGLYLGAINDVQS